MKLVAPYTGAWIETLNGDKGMVQVKSHLIRVRGLKQSSTYVPNVTSVAPYTGAWIETVFCFAPEQQAEVAPYTGAWIETLREGKTMLLRCRTLYGCVD